MRPLALFLVVVFVTSPVHAGIFDSIRIRSNHRVTSVRLPVVQKSAGKFRIECSNGTCRRIEVK